MAYEILSLSVWKKTDDGPRMQPGKTWAVRIDLSRPHDDVVNTRRQAELSIPLLKLRTVLEPDEYWGELKTDYFEDSGKDGS